MAAQPLYQQQMYPVQQERLLDRMMNKAGAIALEYWALIITVLLGIIVLLALSVPFLTYLGLDVMAKPIFYSLHLICAQIPAHSFYILGHQLGMCARNMGIYTSMFAGGLLFVLSKKQLRGIPWWIWILLILPMAYDGLTQMFGLRESTWEIRVITGALFGFANMWFVLPLIQKTLNEMVPASLPVPMQTLTLAMQAPTVAPMSAQQIIQTLPPLQQTPIPASCAIMETPLPSISEAPLVSETEEEQGLASTTEPAASTLTSMVEE